MDGSLPENHRFRLNEDNNSNSDGKFYIFIKLTDSCLKTIETYLKSNKKSNVVIKSNIRLNQHGGVIFFLTFSQRNFHRISLGFIYSNQFQ